MPRTQTKIIRAGAFHRRPRIALQSVTAGNGASNDGFNRAATAQNTPHRSHSPIPEPAPSLIVIINPNARVRPDRQVSQRNKGITRRGGASAQPQPDTIPPVSL